MIGSSVFLLENILSCNIHNVCHNIFFADLSEEDPYSVASELTDMMHDITVLAKVHQLVSLLKLSYQVPH